MSTSVLDTKVLLKALALVAAVVVGRVLRAGHTERGSDDLA
jgi:hypothetical protein